MTIDGFKSCNKLWKVLSTALIYQTFISVINDPRGRMVSVLSFDSYIPSSSLVGCYLIFQRTNWKITEMCLPFSRLHGHWMVTEMRLKSTFPIIIHQPFSRLKGEISSFETQRWNTTSLLLTWLDVQRPLEKIFRYSNLYSFISVTSKLKKHLVKKIIKHVLRNKNLTNK